MNVPSDFPVSISCITRQLLDQELIAIDFKRRSVDKYSHVRMFVDVDKVKKVAKKQVDSSEL